MILASITELGETLDQVEANDEDDTSNKGYRPPKHVARKGSPDFEITAGQLQFLTKYGISASKIAETFHVSESTIRRRLRFQNNNHGLSTEKHRSPNALFVTGILNNMNSDCIALRDLLSEPNTSAANENIPPQTEEDETNEDDNISSTLRTELRVTEDINNVPNGGDLYVRAKQILSRVLRD
ncbi:unnamed protein product [Mytilus coruscus]|uniref:Uncharacterized protein n=1 Tax=Mytilus coruscus TaxID=42192 RepID=A0A6J8DB31_MYTCO|nr:unnamed protein product [Mytilus coruscus]